MPPRTDATRDTLCPTSKVLREEASPAMPSAGETVRVSGDETKRNPFESWRVIVTLKDPVTVGAQEIASELVPTHPVGRPAQV